MKRIKDTWINIKDHLPPEENMGIDDREFSDSILVTNDKDIIEAIYSRGEWCYEDKYEGLQKLWISDEVTHWMYKPQLPRE